MPQTPALGVALRPLRPAMVAPACLIRSAGVTPPTRSIAGWLARLVSERIPPGDLPDIARAAAPPSIPLMPPEEVAEGLEATLAEPNRRTAVRLIAPIARSRRVVGRRSKGLTHGAS